MKYSIRVFGAALPLLACRSQPPVVYADIEGPRIGARPPHFRPSRTAEQTLRAANRGRLVIRTQAGFEPTSAVVTLLARDAQQTIEQTSSSVGVAVFDDLLPGEYTATCRRVGLGAQSVRLMIASGFADTLHFSLGQR